MKSLNGIGERLRQWRQKECLALDVFSVKTGIPLGSIKKYEAGSSLPGSKALGGFLLAGININWLLTGDGEMTAGITLSIEPKKPTKELMPEKFIVTLHGDVYLCNARKVTEE